VLRELGCELGQGHLFSPALTPEDATQFLIADLAVASETSAT